jgi:hypothetical protein
MGQLLLARINVKIRMSARQLSPLDPVRGRLLMACIRGQGIRG